ncbi:diguanylate cyclase [Sulfurospirillum sp. T05]|uniref:diguanylate cyclase n=1 Tax=Sulfurospirillum tamanense TaxID=2813362 RepID=A0ABS2WT34_9BACT|nr:diguanylate cyclase [Sulfurospirillum tamanensis]
MKRLRLLSSYVLLYCLLQGAASYFLLQRYNNDAKTQAELSKSHFVATYQTTLNTFRLLPLHVFEGMIYFREFTTMVANASEASLETKEHLRKTIFQALKPVFESHLSPHGFNQLQLHLRTGERFVQLFDPLTYGDNLLHLASIKNLYDTPRFSEGLNSISGDYHYFFPLYAERAFVGYIEMSLPFETLMQRTIPLLKEYHQALILKDSQTGQNILKPLQDSLSKGVTSNTLLTYYENQKQPLSSSYLSFTLAIPEVDGSVSGELLAVQNNLTIATLYKQAVQDFLFSAILLVLGLIMFALYQKQKNLARTLVQHDEAIEETVQERTDALVKHNSFMRSLFHTIPLPAFLNDKEGRFVECNEAFAKLFRLSKEQIMGALFEEIMDKVAAEEARNANAYVLKIQHPFSYEYRMSIGGVLRDFVIHKNVLKENEHIVGAVGIMQEITERKNYQLSLERALEENNTQKQKLAQDHSIINRYAIYVKLDTVGVITEASEAMAHVSGFSKSELVGKGWYHFCIEPPESIVELRERMRTKADWEGKLSFERKDGNTYWLHCSLIAQFSKDGTKTGYLVFAKDISNEVRIKGLIYIDELTQIYNRKKLNETLISALHIAQRYPDEQSAFILFDIDDFKAVNDTHGHLVGDSILQELSALVAKNLRDVDTFARWGGEEFAVIAPKTSLEGALKITEKLRHLVSSHHFKNVEHITCSFGITEIKPTDTQDDLLKRADEALYSSKSKGKNRIEFLG